VDLEALRAPANLALLPRMTAEDLAAPGLLSMSQDEVARVVSLPSSGTSGPPKRLFFSQADLARTLDFFAVGMGTLCAAGDVALVLLPGRRPWGVADLLEQALPRFGGRALAAPEDWTPDSLPWLMTAQGVSTLVAAPTQLARLLTLPSAVQGALRSLGAVLSSGEPLPDALRAQVQRAWGCEVFDHWGMTETGFGGGVECRAHSGYHLREADLFIEVADARGQPLPPDGKGDTGEILVTTLGERAMPLVRYRTGDAAAWLPGPCPCGSPLRRLGRVPGRLAEGGAGILQPAKGRGT
jgi:phenylacetate-CoA ligase